MDLMFRLAFRKAVCEEGSSFMQRAGQGPLRPLAGKYLYSVRSAARGH